MPPPKKTSLKIEATATQLASLNLLIDSKKLNPGHLAGDNTDLLGEIVITATAVATAAAVGTVTPLAVATLGLGIGTDVLAVLTRTINNGTSMILKDAAFHKGLEQIYKNMSLEQLIEVRNLIVTKKG